MADDSWQLSAHLGFRKSDCIQFTESTQFTHWEYTFHFDLVVNSSNSVVNVTRIFRHSLYLCIYICYVSVSYPPPSWFIPFRDLSVISVDFEDVIVIVQFKPSSIHLFSKLQYRRGFAANAAAVDTKLTSSRDQLFTYATVTLVASCLSLQTIDR